VAEGKEAVFMEGNQLVARLIPAGKRIAGLRQGAAIISKDFDAPLPDEFWTSQQE
jgi:antitoxin (DNA-binding transcriptional repressor) of toxin-antitoxin stability system